MALLDWRECYSVGVSALDADHRRMFDLINQLHEAREQRRGAAVVASVIAGLRAHADTHFAREEAMMAKVGYPDLDQHRASHRRIAERISEFAAMASDADESLPRQVLDFMKAWLVNHILLSDLDLYPWFQRGGLADPPAGEPAQAPGLVARLGRRLDFLGMRRRIALLAVLPLAAFVVGAVIGAGDRIEIAGAAATMELAVTCGTEIGAMIDALEMESGLAAQALAGTGGPPVQDPRPATDDRQRARLEAALRAVSSRTGARHGRAGLEADALAGAPTALARLAGIRAAIAAHSLKPEQAITAYAAVIGDLIAALASIEGLATGGDAARDLAALHQLIRLKQTAGEERGIVATGLAGAMPAAEFARRMVTLDASQRTLEGVFLSLADEDDKALFRQLTADPAAAETAGLRAAIIDGAAVTPTAWFAAATVRIDRLRQATDGVSRHLADEARAIHGQALRSAAWLVAVIVAVLAAAAGLAAVLNASIVPPLAALTQVMRRLADGERALDVPMTEARDQLGEMARALQYFRRQLIVSDLQTAQGWVEAMEHKRSLESQEEMVVARLRGIFDSAVDAIVSIGPDDTIVEFSPSAEALFGYTEAEAVGGQAGALIIPPDKRERHAVILRQVVESGGATLTRRQETILMRKDGSLFPAVFNSTLVTVRGQPLLTSFIRDISRRRLAEEATRKLSRAVEQSPTSIMITDLQGNIEYVNPRFSECTGYSRDEAIGRNPRFLKSGETSDGEYARMWEAISAGQEWHGEFHNRRKDGTLFWERASISPIRDGRERVSHFLAIKEDITLHKAYEERLVQQANYDGLTGLPNRMLAMDRLGHAIAAAQRGRSLVAVMFIDLDDFKKVNDTFGHFTGDKLLVAVASRVRAVLRQVDTVARLGGDEFLVILQDMDAVVMAEIAAKKILACLEQPLLIDGLELYVGASIGLTLFPTDAASPEVLLRNADTAMYRAKAAGRNAIRFFSAEMSADAEARVALETRLRAAFKAGELTLVYQPMIASASGRLVGAEALLRWTHPELGPVPPDRFIAAAEHIGLIVPITEWVLREACAVARAWREQCGRPIRIAVNISSQSFRSTAILDIVRQVLADNAMAAGSLELEITERVMIDETTETKFIMDELSRMGARLSIDDFGTGYSSLSYLKRFPFDTLKIDKSFVQGAEGSAIVTAIIAMAKSLGLETVGEGVEEGGQLDFLGREGCDVMQGYLLGRPMAAAAIAAMLESGG